MLCSLVEDEEGDVIVSGVAQPQENFLEEILSVCVCHRCGIERVKPKCVCHNVFLYSPFETAKSTK